MDGSAASRPAADSAAGGPAADLAEVWDALDALPPARAGIDLAATTVDLVAAGVAGSAAEGRGGPGPTRWLVPAAVVAAALLGGLAVGRVVAPDPDRPVLARLPLIEHLDLLQEAGSVAFLESLAERMETDADQPALRLRLLRDPQANRDEARDFDACLERLRSELAAGDDAPTLERRRTRLESLPAADLAALQRSADAFARLGRLTRDELAAVARVLADPEAARLRDAARTWHVLVAAAPPLFRQDVIEMDAERRLEWIERPGGMERRGGFPGRPRENGRRPGPPPPGFSRPRVTPPRPPFSGPGDGPPAGPPETRAPPR